ncbi:MAG: hypothetical protein ABII82_08965 [Verrucomicrobiota bacterium]
MILPLVVFLVNVGLPTLVAASFIQREDPAERMGLATAATLLGLYAIGFGAYSAGVDRVVWWLWPLVASATACLRARAVLSVLRAPKAREIMAGWLAFAAWSIGLLLFVRCYGGGGWAVDWWEHLQRARIFSQGLSPDTPLVHGMYSMGARPPMGNAIMAVLLWLGGDNLTRYVVLNTLLSSLIFFPAILLARGWTRGTRSLLPFTTAAVLMLNPMTAQNLSYAWTRHLCAFWILLGSHLLLRGIVRGDSIVNRTLGWLALGAGLLTHYSTGPYIAVWLIVYAIIIGRRLPVGAFLVESSRHALWCGLLLATWFLWSYTSLGWSGTVASNTTMTGAGAGWWANLTTFALNVRDTLVPHVFRTTTTGIPAQPSAWGAMRDLFFNLYQVNLPMMLGTAGLLCLGLRAVKAKQRPRWGWVGAITSLVLIGVGVHTQRDDVGLGHICLQPLVLIGLTKIAAVLAQEEKGGVLIAWKAGAMVDCAVGIVLTFALQTMVFGSAADYSLAVRINQYALSYLRDSLPGSSIPNALPWGLLMTGGAMWWTVQKWRAKKIAGAHHLDRIQPAPPS